MRSHIAEGAALALAAPAFITAAFIAAVFTVAQPYAAEWRSASAPLPLVQLPTELTARNAAAAGCDNPWKDNNHVTSNDLLVGCVGHHRHRVHCYGFN